MNLTKNLTLVFLFFAIHIANAQSNKSDNILGSNYTFLSKTTGETQQLQVYLPENYTTNTSKNYPVLYVLDGQNWFSSAVSLSRVFTGNTTNFKSIPDFIVVGITTNWEKRRTFFASANKKNALNFIENEVLTFVDKQFRTSKERILYGWQFAGGFVLNTLAEKPNLFSGYLAATPVFYNPSVLNTLFSKHPNLEKFLYIAGTKEEANDWVEPTVKLLEEKASKDFDWTYKEISAHGAFGHRISPVETLAYGLRAYFYDYPLLEFKNIQDFTTKGGLKYVNEFYVKRAKKYGVSEDMGEWGRHILLRLAMRENHFKTFETLMNEFKKTSFIEHLGNWQIGAYAKVYLNNNRPDEAIQLYGKIAKKNPESPGALHGLGKAYLLKGARKKAIVFFKKAISYAEKNKNPNLNTYKMDLEKIINP